jgi:MFS family permease
MACYTAFMTLVGGPFLVGFVQMLCRDRGVPPDQWIGWLVAIPSLLGILQIPGAIWGRRHASYKRFVTPGWLLWRLFYLPVVALPFLALSAHAKLWILALCVALSWTAVYMANPVFFDWLAELVPPRFRGWYFSRRNALAAAVGAVVGLLGAAVVDYCRSIHRPIYGYRSLEFGYGVVFALAVLFALIGQFCFSRMQDMERPSVVRENLGKSWDGFIRAAGSPDFRAVLYFFAVFVFAQTFAGNFFTAYALESLRMPFLAVNTLAFVQAAVNVAFAPVWGWLADRYGNKPMLALSGFGMVFTALPWVVCVPGRPVTNLCILVPAHMFSGVVWGGIAICQFNLLLATAKEEDRANCLGAGMAVQAFVGGVAPILGACAMSLLRPPHSAGPLAVAHAYKTLFVITSSIRLLSVLFIAGVREPGAARLTHALRDIGRRTPGLGKSPRP